MNRLPPEVRSRRRPRARLPLFFAICGGVVWTAACPSSTRETDPPRCEPQAAPEVAGEPGGPVALHLSFQVPDAPFKEQFFLADLTGDGHLDFTYRSKDSVYVFDHRGRQLWSVALANPQVVLSVARGTAHAAADVDGTGRKEVVALDDRDRLHVLDGRTGEVRWVTELPRLHPRSRWAYVASVNLRGRGDRDLVLQTVDERDERPWMYLNRNLLAWDMEGNRELWRVVQGDDPDVAPWQGYWGPAHGPFRTADVTGDGRDEVLGGNLVEHDGTVVDLGYSRDWIRVREAGFVSHLDAVVPAKVRTDVPGWQWVVVEEDHGRIENWHTVLLSRRGLLWRHETALFPAGAAREPQNVAIGRFDPERSDAQIWVRSRFPLWSPQEEVASQHPWVLDGHGRQIAHWRASDVLPPGFNTHEEGNCRGLEMISAIDWNGDGQHRIAGMARHVDGNVGVFDALTGESVWHTPRDAPPVEATLIYVADATADGREELVIHDAATSTIKVYRNAAPAPGGAASRWEEPNYRRIKRNWNYYSP